MKGGEDVILIVLLLFLSCVGCWIFDFESKLRVLESAGTLFSWKLYWVAVEFYCTLPTSTLNPAVLYRYGIFICLFKTGITTVYSIPVPYYYFLYLVCEIKSCAFFTFQIGFFLDVRQKIQKHHPNTIFFVLG